MVYSVALRIGEQRFINIMCFIPKLTLMKHFLLLFLMQLSKCSQSKGTHVNLQVKYFHTLLKKKKKKDPCPQISCLYLAKLTL